MYVILYNVQVCKIVILGRFGVRLRHKLLRVIKVIINIIIIISCYLPEDGSMTKRNILENQRSCYMQINVYFNALSV